MYLTKELKKEIFRKHGNKDTNTGSAESQIALFTHRIDHLTTVLEKQKKNYNTQRALINLVSKRKRLLDHLRKSDINRYRTIIKTLDIRK